MNTATTNEHGLYQRYREKGAWAARAGLVALGLVLLGSLGAGADWLQGGNAHAAPPPILAGKGGETPATCPLAWSVVDSPNVSTRQSYLNGVAAVSANDVWAVGSYINGSVYRTLVQHWDGRVWSVVPSPNVSSDNDLSGVAVVSANDVWAVGSYYIGSVQQTLVEHWTGGPSWTVVPSASPGKADNKLLGVTVVSANNVWAVGSYYNGATNRVETLVERWTGGPSWTVVPSANASSSGFSVLEGVAAVSANDVWAVGNYYNNTGNFQTLIEHWTGGPSWTVVPSVNPGPDSKLYGVAAVSANDVWAVGDFYSADIFDNPRRTLVEHWTGGPNWTVVESADTTWPNEDYLRSVAAVSANDLWAVGFYRDESSGSEARRTLIEHWTGGPSWTMVPSANPGPSKGGNYVLGVAVVSANDVWAVGNYLDGDPYSNSQTLAEHWTGGPSWNVVPSDSPGVAENNLYSVAAVSANDVWAVGDYYNTIFRAYETLVEHWDGTSWSVVSSPNAGPTDNYLNGVAAVSANDVWAVGYYLNDGVYQTLVEHWDGTTRRWSVIPSPNVGTGYNALNGVAAVSANDVWAVGSYTYINGSTSTQQTLVEHWDGTTRTWSVIPSPNVGTGYNALNGVAAVSANDVWAVGFYLNASGTAQTLVEHWDGISWSVVPSPNVGTSTNRLYGVEAVSANDVWAVGEYFNGSTDQTLVEHWDGTSWSVVSSPNVGTSRNELRGVSAVSANDVWAVGFYVSSTGTLRTLVEHWNGTGVVSSPNVGTNDNYLLGVAAVSANDVWAVGDYYNNTGTAQTLVEHYAETCSIVGHVTWQGRPPQPSILQQLPISLTLEMGSIEVNYPARTTDASGFFTVSVSSLASGTYNWRAKSVQAGASPPEYNPGFLAVSGTLTLAGTQVTNVEMGTQRAGDCNNDNIVNSVDFVILKNAFGRLSGQPQYDARADISGDYVVNVVDFSQLKANFGLGGALRLSFEFGIMDPGNSKLKT